MMKIGFIGLGNMGAGMAANLQKAGYELVVHDIVREAGAEHIERGALWADSPAEVARASEVVFTSLPGPREVESVATGPNGVLAGISAGKVYVDLSTVYPDVVRRIHEKFAEAGAHMLEAPVSGSTIGANTGRLAIMAGGEKEVYERCKPLFEAIGDHPTHTGPIGTGAVCKLAHNCMSYSIQAIAAECYTLGVKAGADPEVLAEVIRNSAVGRAVHFNFIFYETFLKGKFDEPHFPMKGAVKDVGLALELAREYDVPMTIGNIAYGELITGLNRGWGDDDARRAMTLQEERAGGVQVRIPEK